MTTPTTSRVSDAMLSIAIAAYSKISTNHPEHRALRAAIEAVLAAAPEVPK